MSVVEEREIADHTSSIPSPPDTPLSASINRIRIVGLGAITLDAAVHGEQAYHLLSVPALIRYALERAEALGLPSGYGEMPPESPIVRREVPRWVVRALESPDPRRREAAQEIARRLGRNLGYILLTLKRGDRINRLARPDWGPDEWQQWAGVRTVWLGGGILSGQLGSLLLQHARALLRGVGYGDVIHVYLLSVPAVMGLLGAARYLPVGQGQALCLDFGQTSVKRAVVTCVDGRLAALHTFPSLPVPWGWTNTPHAGDALDPQDVLAFTVETLCGTYRMARRAGFQPSSEVVASVAAYVRGGRLEGHGMYARMTRIASDVRGLVAERAICDGWRPRPVRFIHDGTAAAALLAGQRASAVILVGTALGVGFPPASATGLRLLAPDLRVEHLSEGRGGLVQDNVGTP